MRIKAVTVFLMAICIVVQQVLSSEQKLELSPQQANAFLTPKRRVKRWWLWSKEHTKQQESKTEYLNALSGSNERKKEEQATEEPQESRR